MNEKADVGQVMLAIFTQQQSPDSFVLISHVLVLPCRKKSTNETKTKKKKKIDSLIKVWKYIPKSEPIIN